MKELFQKITNSLLSILFAALAVSTVYYFTDQEKAHLLSGSILDGLAPSAVTAVEFVSPKGTAYPINGVVTINSVFVTTTGTDGNVSGADLTNSFITFSNGSVPCPVGTAFNGNQIVLPPTFSGFCTVNANDPDTTPASTVELRIEAVSCANLQTSILRGLGSGFETISETDLGDFGVSNPVFDFNGVTPVSSVDLNYPSTAVQGAKTFQTHLTFVPDVSIDPVNGISDRAVIVSNNGAGVHNIKVRTEGTGKEVSTALNFAYVFNDLLGADSPFLAYQSGADAGTILLQAREMGAHSSDYVCLVNGAQSGPPCFTGGADGIGEAADVLTRPLKLDNEIVQGETAIVFAAGSAGEVEWISSHPAMLEVVSLSEAAQQDSSSVDFVDDTLDVPPAVQTVTASQGAYNITDCDAEYDENNDYVSGTETCTVTASIPVSYNISGIDYVANVSIGDEVVEVTVSGSTLSGFLGGTGTYTSANGLSIPLAGTVTGVVTGSVSGEFSGTVSGQITATVQAAGSKTGQVGKLTVTNLTSAFSVGTVTRGVLADVSGSFISTVKKQESDISHVSLLYGKRPGSTILTAIDAHGCIASFDIRVIEKKVILEMVGRNPGDVLDVSDTVQINAFVGGANAEKDEYENITAATGIEWFSSNEDVATIDATGLLTALKPGSTNITARYDTGEAEIGTIESVPMQVTVNKIAGLRITFDSDTEDSLPSATVQAAHKSVMIAIHNPEARGHTLNIEGQQVTIDLPAGDYESEIARVTAIADDLNTKLAALMNSTPAPIVAVSTVQGYPGMLILQPLNQSADADGDLIQDIDENGIIDVSTTALEDDMSILPTYSNAIPLPASETYGLRVIAKYDNGATKLLSPTQFKWVNTPVNYLQQASLDSGFIKLGEISGTSTVVAQFANADGSTVLSNYLTIKVDSGPVIEFVRRIGSGPITKGSRINLQTKITDVNTISDIVDISTSLVYSNYSTYTQINSDSTAIWFSATPFLQEVAVQTQGSTQVSEEGEGEGEATPAPVVTALQFKTYDIPVEIPVDQNLFDGVYKLILTIVDANNHTLNYVYPIRIGNIGKGDVNGDGMSNMVDVIIAFQIASGILPNPTPSQLEAANVDGIGGVTLVDVILLFRTVTAQ